MVALIMFWQVITFKKHTILQSIWEIRKKNKSRLHLVTMNTSKHLQDPTCKIISLIFTHIPKKDVKINKTISNPQICRTA